MFGVIDLNCEGYEIKAGSIDHGHDGFVFRCTIRPVSEEVWSGLNAAAQIGSAVRLVFPERPLVLERVEVVRIDHAGIRIGGRVLDGQAAKEKGWPP